MQCVVNSLNCALENGVWMLGRQAKDPTNDIIKFLDMLLDEIVNLAVESLVAVGVCLSIRVQCKMRLTS